MAGELHKGNNNVVLIEMKLRDWGQIKINSKRCDGT